MKSASKQTFFRDAAAYGIQNGLLMMAPFVGQSYLCRVKAKELDHMKYDLIVTPTQLEHMSKSFDLNKTYLLNRSTQLMEHLNK